MKLIKDGRKALLAGVALVACIGFTFNAQAQTCVVTNWASQTDLVDADAGTQGSSNRRYGGPCGLRVPVDGTARYVSDDTPNAEGTYIARFYTFLDNAGSNATILFEGDDGTDPQIQVWYNMPNAGDLTLRVYDTTAGSPIELTEAGVGAGWHSVEFVWEAAASAEILFNVDGAASDLSDTVDTSGITIENAHLGNVDGASGGSVDFDDFDSRRIERPGRLMVGDANDDATINSQDFVTVINEIGGTYAAGQPDCNEDGSINSQDFVCVINIIGS